jgi:hypothetical protein
MVCMDAIHPQEVYVVRCGSLVDHTMCQSCAGRWRTISGTMTCPTCRGVEPTELADAYTRHAQLTSTRQLPEYIRTSVMSAVTRAAQPTLVERRRPEWCQSGRLQLGRCFTRSKTARECAMAGCQQRVCRACVMCDSHTDF